MSDTPRTDLNHLTVETLRTMKGTGTKIVLASVARQLERELNAAKERIERLEEAARAVYIDSIVSDHPWSELETRNMHALRDVLENNK